jgi:SDR family mycofactocin-dependent oxidoreductase
LTGRVSGRVALVTGAGRGQGRAHCVRLAEEGADVIAIDICGPLSPEIPYEMATDEDLKQTARLVEATGGQCVTAVADVRDIIQVRAAVETGIAELGRLDIVVANAGVISTGYSWELTDDAWDVVIDTNLKGTWNTTRATIPHLIDAGHGGSIVLVSSAAGIRGHLPYSHYVASKHGIVGLMKALANEVGRHNIRVNSLHPTAVTNTGLSLNKPPEVLAAEDPLFGIGAMNVMPVDAVEPRDVANAVLFLASDEARYVTGLQMTVDAGATNKP